MGKFLSEFSGFSIWTWNTKWNTLLLHILLALRIHRFSVHIVPRTGYNRRHPEMDEIALYRCAPIEREKKNMVLHSIRGQGNTIIILVVLYTAAAKGGTARQRGAVQVVLIYDNLVRDIYQYFVRRLYGGRARKAACYYSIFMPPSLSLLLSPPQHT